MDLFTETEKNTLLSTGYHRLESMRQALESERVLLRIFRRACEKCEDEPTYAELLKMFFKAFPEYRDHTPMFRNRKLELSARKSLFLVFVESKALANTKERKSLVESLAGMA